MRPSLSIYNVPLSNIGRKNNKRSSTHIFFPRFAASSCCNVMALLFAYMHACMHTAAETKGELVRK